MTVPQIHVLSDRVANLIAAGEVVERPASVVKELVENALDAGARDIAVEVAAAGFSSLRVTDDGYGMPPEDAKLAFHRHATSKISGAEDLNRIATLGFRGEALPSIAAVSRVELTTRPQARSAGYRLVLEAGAVVEEGEAGCAAGTSFMVRDLFFNTPARRKFMKSPATEQSHIVQGVEWAALAHIGVRFRLSLDGRETLNCPATDSLADRITIIYGKAAPRQLLDIDLEGGGVRVRGLAAGPDASRPTRQGMHFFINGRPIEHRGLFHAALEAYKPLLPDGRFPTCFVFLEMPAHLVDVNVHPAKREVRLRDEHGMHDLVVRAVKGALEKSDLFLRTEAAEHAFPARGLQAPAPRQRAFPTSPPESGWSGERVRDSVASFLDRMDDSRERPAAAPAAPQPQEADTGESVDAIRVIGQVGRTYIAAQDKDGFYLVDQHAAHERLLYEDLRRGDREVPRQGLLLPLTLELSPAQTQLLAGTLDIFRELGVEMSAFGRNAFIIQTQPAMWERGDLIRTVRDLLDWTAELGRTPSAEELKDRAMKLMACHAAVKAGDRLQPETMQALIRRMEEIPPPLTCPHGRPFVYRLTWPELERLFKRT